MALTVNQEFLDRIDGLYRLGKSGGGYWGGSGGAYYSVTADQGKFLWCYWETKADVWIEEGKVNQPLMHGREDTAKAAIEMAKLTAEENRPSYWRPYMARPDGENGSYYLYETCDVKDYRRHYKNPEGDAAEAFRRRLLAEKRAHRKKRVDSSRILEFAYVHITWTNDFRTRDRKKMNIRYSHGGKRSKHQTEMYRIYKKTPRRIYIERGRYKPGESDIFGDYRDFTVRAYVVDRQEFEAGYVRHSQLGWITPDPIHPEGAVPATGAAIQKEPCFVALGLKWPCTADDVKKAFRAKSKKTHPDLGGDPDEFAKLVGYKDIALQMLRRFERMKKRKKGGQP